MDYTNQGSRVKCSYDRCCPRFLD